MSINPTAQIVIFANASGSGLGADRLLGGGAGSAAASAAASGGPVTALSFRTGAGVPLLAAGGGGGALTVWNLEERRLHTVVRDAHAAGLVSGAAQQRGVWARSTGRGLRFGGCGLWPWAAAGDGKHVAPVRTPQV